MKNQEIWIKFNILYIIFLLLNNRLKNQNSNNFVTPFISFTKMSNCLIQFIDRHTYKIYIYVYIYIYDTYLLKGLFICDLGIYISIYLYP